MRLVSAAMRVLYIVDVSGFENAGAADYVALVIRQFKHC